jgi:signal transduction histidine kinase
MTRRSGVRSRLRFALVTAGILAAVLLAFTLYEYAALRSLLHAQQDELLRRDVRIVVARLAANAEPTLEPVRGDAIGWVEVHGRDGSLLHAAAPEGRGPERIPDRPGAIASAHGQAAYSVETPGPNGAILRVLESESDVRGRNVRIRVARTEEKIRTGLDDFLLRRGLALPLAAAVAGAVAFAMGGWVLAPLERLLARQDGALDRLRHAGGDVAHELRTPLATMRSRGELALRSARSAQELREDMGDMLELVNRMSGLVEDMLFMSRAESGDLHLRGETFDAGEVLHDAADLLAVLAEEGGVGIDVDAPRPLPVVADRSLLRQAVANLLHNALKHSPRGARVRLRGSHVGDRVLLVVEDAGEGIAPEYQARIFDRFYRVETDRSRVASGAGLGLALSRSIVHALHGEIRVDSEPGRGSAFSIDLPAAPV